jgi:hypothetical protein
MAKEPLKLPLKDLERVVKQMAKLPKDAVEGAMPRPKRAPTKRKRKTRQ